MKKIIIIFVSIFFYSCDEYSRGQFVNVFNGKYKSDYKLNKISGQQVDLRNNRNVPKYTFTSGKFKIQNDSLEVFRIFDSKVNFDLTDRNSKKYIWERDIYYNLVDSLTFKEYSIKVRAITKDRTQTDELEISNLIEGKYDISKDTLIYKCSKVN